jgi:hypothetical protein
MYFEGEDREQFYIEDHAALFGYIAQSAQKRFGEEGKSAIIKGIITYGRERGLRAALRCRRDKQELTMRNYRLYGEWWDPKGGSQSEIVSTSPSYRTNTLRCAWCETWKELDLLPYAKLYCEYVDKNLVFGFNPALTLEMGATLSGGGHVCEFNWVGYSEESPEEAQAFGEERKALIPRVTQDFLYHCGHVLHSFRHTLLLELGAVKGEAILLDTIHEYIARFGSQKIEMIIQESKQDFLTV